MKIENNAILNLPYGRKYYGHDLGRKIKINNLETNIITENSSEKKY